jgi:hypothetical protein
MPKTRFHSLLEQRIDERIKSVGDSLLRGEIKEFTEYKDMTGYLRGLRDALKLCDDIEGEYD